MAIVNMEREEEDLQKELGALSPHLPPKQFNPPPEGYFEGLPEKVLPPSYNADTTTFDSYCADCGRTTSQDNMRQQSPNSWLR